MKLYHGSYQEIRPEIKIGEFALKGLDNVFDGLFASAYRSEAEAHGKFIHEFEIEDEKIASSQDLDVPEVVFEVLSKETNIEDDEKIEALYNVVLDDGDFSDLEDAGIAEEDLNCRASCDFEFSAAGWEIQRLRGRVAAALGFKAVECRDEHGTSYLIVSE
ncbi:hypothetical protein [Haemophilus haemolyticus]|uniref:hypothetical protein n=1 Tax=Haemophilus haemolyticus TaxID=726 RepID=UPI000E591AB1|nr:hypothetical protein [Haemophilus haemolyticus]